MLRKMLAQVMFLNPNDLNRGTAELIEHDFDVEYLDDWIDDYGRAVLGQRPDPQRARRLQVPRLGTDHCRARWRRRV